MSDSPKTNDNQGRRLRKSWIVRFLKFFIIFFCLTLVALYFLLQSEWLYRTFVFPRLARATGGSISVGTMEIQPWHLIQLRDVRFEDELGNVNTMGTLSFRYQVLPLISGEAILEELSVKDAVVHLDYFLNSNSESASNGQEIKEKDEIVTPKEKTLELYPKLGFLFDLKKIKLENLSFIVPGSKIGTKFPKLVQLNKVSLRVDDFQSDSGGDLDFGFNLVSEGEQSILPSHAEGHIKSVIELQPDRESVGLRVNIDLNNVQGEIENIVLDKASLSLGALLKYSNKGISLGEVSIKSSNSNSPLLIASGSGKIDFSDQGKYSGATFETKIDAIHNEVLSYIPELSSPIEDGVLAGKISGSLRPAKEFSAKGELTLENFQLERSQINKELPASAKLKFSVSGNDGISKIESSVLEISSKEELLGEVQFVGSLSSIDSKTSLNGDLSSSRLALDNILALLPKADAKEKDNKKDLPEEENDKAFEAILQVKLSNATYGEISAKDGSALITYGENLLKGEQVVMTLNDAPLKGSFIISMIKPMYKPTIDVDIRKLEIQPVVRSFDKKMAKNLSGEMQRFTFRVKNSWDPKDKGDAERDGDFRATFKNLKIPAYLQDTPPINLIFLPIDALDYTVGQIGSVFVPASIVKATEVVDIENRSGQVAFQDAQIRGLINAKGITLQDTKFDSAILPTFNFYGAIDFDEDLDLVIGIELLKVPVPLPVTGTLSLPLPDLVGFIPAVVKSLGLSVTNIGGMFDSDKEKEMEFFGDGGREGDSL